MSTIRHSVQDGIARVVLDHPPLNILTRDALTASRAALADLASDPSVRVLVLSATGRHFSAGADVGEHLPPVVDEMIPEFLETVTALDTFPLPTIAAVQGKCLGGGFEIVLGADFVIAADNAVFGQPEIVLGVVPPAACAMLPTRTTRGIAADLIFTGDPLPAADAQHAGLVRRVVPLDDLETTALDLAARISRHSAAALRVAKRSLRGPDREHQEAAMTAARAAYLDDLMATADALEGLTAFVERRQPTWRHR